MKLPPDEFGDCVLRSNGTMRTPKLLYRQPTGTMTSAKLSTVLLISVGRRSIGTSQCGGENGRLRTFDMREISRLAHPEASRCGSGSMRLLWTLQSSIMQFRSRKWISSFRSTCTHQRAPKV